MSARRLSGTRTCFPLKMVPSSTVNSSRNDQKTRTADGRSLTLSLILRMPFFLGQITSSVVKTSLRTLDMRMQVIGLSGVFL